MNADLKELRNGDGALLGFVVLLPDKIYDKDNPKAPRVRVTVEPWCENCQYHHEPDCRDR